MESLKGKVAFITGGSRGIGLAIARALVSEGVQVTMTGRSDAHLSAARPQIERAGPGAVETLRADVRRYADVEQALAATVARFGGLDVVINNAGVGIFADVADMSPDQWSEVIDTNLTGVFHVCHAAIPHLRRRGGGFIINISSLAGKNAFATGAAYCASKAGLNAFSEALMQEVRYDDIRVSYIMPGSVATGFSNGDPSKGADWKIAPDEVADVVLNLLHHNPRSISAEPRRAPAVQAEKIGNDVRLRQTPRRARASRDDDGQRAGTRLAVALDLLTELTCPRRSARGVYCRSERFPGKPRMDIALVLEQLDDAKQLVQSAMESYAGL